MTTADNRGTCRNLLVSLPSTAPVVPVTIHLPHPCGGYYIEEALVYGPTGCIGRWINTDA
jgi:hypothetical protein